MIHGTRRYNVVTGLTVGDIAHRLRASTMTLCTGFLYHHGDGHDYLILNDSFGEDGAQEYAIVRVLDGRDAPDFTMVEQVDSITVSWGHGASRVADLFCAAMIAPTVTTAASAFRVCVERDAPYPHCALCA